MVRALRRVFWLAMFGGAGFAGWTALQRRNEPAIAGPGAADPAAGSKQATVERATVEQAPVEPAPVGFVPIDIEPPAGRSWVEPADGACPADYPIKGNASSGIFHMPGGRFYERTIPERCYASAEDAEADGYRRAKA